MASLFQPYRLGELSLKNRIVMAPLTRSRAGEGEVPRQMNAEYYAQRASAGLIVSEATQISQQGQGYLFTPGIFTSQQVEGWKLVTDAVHARQGAIFMQLWHVGRISHVRLQPNGDAPISSTDKAAEHSYSFTYDESGKPAHLPVSRPRVPSKEELRQVVADYATGARNLAEAGFDGAEIHAANGYLLDQHLNSAVNERDDEYGTQSKETRTRLTLEAFEAVAAVIGADRVGIRIAPYGAFNGMKPDPKVEETFLHLASELSKRGAAYVHIVLGSQYDVEPVVPESFLRAFREAFSGSLIVTGGLTKQKAERLLADDFADLFGFGVLFISNPDLPERLKNDLPLTPPDKTTFYGGGAHGYTDYPVYQPDLVAQE